MSAKKQTEKNLRQRLIDLYMEYMLEQGHQPASVYSFCKTNKIKEEDFYKHFGSFKALSSAIWISFHDKTIELLHKNDEYPAFENRDKLLSYFYTFFELLTLNRSYVLASLDTSRRSIIAEQLSPLRRKIREYAKELIEDANSSSNSVIGKRNPQIFSEGAWWHFLFLLKFWAEDSSPAFEKTDIAIEKSVTTVFDLFDNTPLESILDFGKFLYKENMA